MGIVGLIRKTAAAAAVSAALLLCGCSPDTDISKRLIVHAVGIDKAEDGQYQVSLQIFSPSGSGSDTPLDPSQANMKVISGKGKNVQEGVRECENIMGSSAFIGHNRLIIFGSSVYDEDMDKLLGWFKKENANYLGVTVAYAENSAKEVLSVPLTDGSSTIENVNDIIRFAKDKGIAEKGDLLTLMNKLNESGGNGVAPVLSVVEQDAVPKEGEESSSGGEESGGSGEKPKEKYLEVVGTAVLKDRKFCGMLNKEESAGLLWLTKEMQTCSVTLNEADEPFNAELTDRNTELRLFCDESGLRLEADITAEIRIPGETVRCSPDRICELAEEKIASQCRAASQKAIGEMSADAFDLEKLTKFYFPQLYRKHKDDFSSLVATADIIVKAECFLND